MVKYSAWIQELWNQTQYGVSHFAPHNLALNKYIAIVFK